MLLLDPSVLLLSLLTLAFRFALYHNRLLLLDPSTPAFSFWTLPCSPFASGPFHARLFPSGPFRARLFPSGPFHAHLFASGPFRARLLLLDLPCLPFCFWTLPWSLFCFWTLLRSPSASRHCPIDVQHPPFHLTIARSPAQLGVCPDVRRMGASPRSLQYNNLDESAKNLLREVAGDRVKL